MASQFGLFPGIYQAQHGLFIWDDLGDARLPLMADKRISKRGCEVAPLPADAADLKFPLEIRDKSIDVALENRSHH